MKYFNLFKTVALFSFTALLFSASSCQNEDGSLGICTDCDPSLDTNGSLVYTLDSITEPYLIVEKSQAQLFDLNKDGHYDFKVKGTHEGSGFYNYKIEGFCPSCYTDDIQNEIVVVNEVQYQDCDARALFYGNDFDTLYNHEARIRYDYFNYPDTRYIGVKFQMGNDMHYGYFKVQRARNKLTIYEIAWNPNPGQPVW